MPRILSRDLNHMNFEEFAAIEIIKPIIKLFYLNIIYFNSNDITEFGFY